MTAITYSSQVLPASRISAKRQLAMLKDSHGTMVTAVAIVLRRQGFMAEEHDGNILISCGGRLYAALHFLRLELRGQQVVALQPSSDVTYFLPRPVIEDAWEQHGDAWVRSSASAASEPAQAGPITLLAEAQFVGINPSSTARIVTSRARWCMAFEIASEEAGRPLTTHHIPPSTWQCEYLGLAANAGSVAMKMASALSAQHVLQRMTGQPSNINGDAADALCINMWALEHFLAGLPRKFRRST